MHESSGEMRENKTNHTTPGNTQPTAYVSADGGGIECSVGKYVFEILGRRGEEPRPWEVSRVPPALDV